mgnify:FL=1
MPFRPLALHHILVRDQTLQPHWAPRMDSARRDPDLRPKPIPKPIRKPRRRIHISAARVHTPHKDRRALVILGHNRVGMV